MLKHVPKNLTPEQLDEYEALVASCRYNAPPDEGGWLIKFIGIICIINLLGLIATLT